MTRDVGEVNTTVGAGPVTVQSECFSSRNGTWLALEGESVLLSREQVKRLIVLLADSECLDVEIR